MHPLPYLFLSSLFSFPLLVIILAFQKVPNMLLLRLSRYGFSTRRIRRSNDHFAEHDSCTSWIMYSLCEGQEQMCKV